MGFLEFRHILIPNCSIFSRSSISDGLHHGFLIGGNTFPIAPMMELQENMRLWSHRLYLLPLLLRLLNMEGNHKDRLSWVA